MTELENHYFAVTLILFQARWMNAKFSRWKFDEKHDIYRLPRWCSGKEFTYQCRRCKRRRFNPWVGKIPWRRKWEPTSVFSPEKFHGHRSLAGYSPWGWKKSDTTEHTHSSTFIGVAKHLPHILFNLTSKGKIVTLFSQGNMTNIILLPNQVIKVNIKIMHLLKWCPEEDIISFL